ncbi:DUF1800 domain-containing protein [Microbulbifer agarilyticus]|uniref:DUF1800 domain-containing protein n=1 Tax=Microbulbifer agarilyticus TaxID=260552 RepID=UPI001CD6C5E4|nr:DUF1800 domain-containing protein [Microbulbifer agarilyticus]MCA0900819.1 DUF1800 domain-containing protein [Microbulbifer agarilyticus]
MTKEEYIALTRFGMGVTPGDLRNPIAETGKTPKQWLKQQLSPLAFDDNLPSSTDMLRSVADYRKSLEGAKKSQSNDGASAHKKKLRSLRKSFNRSQNTYNNNVIQRAAAAHQSINWRLLDFFSNHFSVSAVNAPMKALAPTLEREVIAPNLTGKFEDLLIAVSQHPAMIVYLDNMRSIGPNSRIGRRRDKGLNENLAREILELHTLGVDGGYTQSDVLELSKAITGWSLATQRDGNANGFMFRSAMHEPGSRRVMGRSFHQSDVSQGEKILKYLATHPSTARYLSLKLARHFISDAPPASLVNKLQQTWLNTDGDILAVMYTLIDAEESWSNTPQKFKTPREFFISALRAADMQTLDPQMAQFSLTELGQAPFQAGSPAGYEDTAENWLSPSLLTARADWSIKFAQRWQERVPAVNQLLNQLFGDHISELTRKSILRAESKQAALAMLLMSPEFQRR